MSDKMHKAFLLMLSATSPGEIVAARDALVRLAQARKQDVHSLARALGLDRAPNGDASPKEDDRDHAEMARFCWAVFEQGARLSEKEQKFVNDMIGWRRPSQKQIDWLTSIYERLKRAR
jgi:hypothetical protein